MATYTQGVPALTDPSPSPYNFHHTVLRLGLAAGLRPPITLTVYKYNGTTWVKQ